MEVGGALQERRTGGVQGQGGAQAPAPLPGRRVGPAARKHERLLKAFAETVLADGYAAATPESVACRAGVCASTFRRHFPSVEACLLEAFDRAEESLATCLREAVSDESSWQQALCNARAAALAWAVRRPEHAHVCFIAPPQAGRSARRRQGEAAGRLYAAARLLIERSTGARTVTPLAYQLYVGAVREAIVTELLLRRFGRSGSVSGWLDGQPRLIAAQLPLDS